jgi:hypothetical protein
MRIGIGPRASTNVLFKTTIHDLCGIRSGDSISKSHRPKGNSSWPLREPSTMWWSISAKARHHSAGGTGSSYRGTTSDRCIFLQAALMASASRVPPRHSCTSAPPIIHQNVIAEFYGMTRHWGFSGLSASRSSPPKTNVSPRSTPWARNCRSIDRQPSTSTGPENHQVEAILDLGHGLTESLPLPSDSTTPSMV